MGMLLTYRKGYWPEGDEPDTEGKRKPRKTRTRRPKAKPVEPTAPEPTPEASPYAELTDDQVAEAYSTNVPDGEAADRDVQVVELEALDAEGNTPE